MHKHLSPTTMAIVAISAVFLLAFAQPSVARTHKPTPPPTPPREAPAPNGLPPAPHALGITAITNTTGGNQPINEGDVRTYVAAHFVPGNMSKDHGVIIAVLRLSSKDAAALLGMPTQVPDATQLWLVELQGHFIFPGSSQQPDGLRFDIAFEVFLANNGNLLMEGGLQDPFVAPPPTGATPTPPAPPVGAVTPTPLPSATNTPVPAPTNTPTPTCHLPNNGTNSLNTDIAYFDFDAGTSHPLSPVPGSDIHYTTGSSPSFAPIQGAAIADLGHVGFAGVSCDTIQHAAYGAASIAMSDGDVFLVRTNGGHYAVVLVGNPTGGHDIITIQWQTYTIS